MSELNLRVIEPVWDEPRTRAALDGLIRRRRRRLWTRGAAALMLSLLVGWQLWPRPQLVRFADGSTAQLLDAESVVEARPREAGLLVAHLSSGRARFAVVRDPTRRFRVLAGEVTVEVLGTQFTVDKLGQRARVAVEHGRVRVAWPGGAVELLAGQSGLFPPDDEIAQLLRAADGARASGRAADAVAPLRRVIDEHSADARAPLAAFTLGRLYLEELHQPEEAAAAFARARALDPDGPLAADARAREAQARGSR